MVEDERLIGALLRVPYQASVAAVEAGLRAAGFDDVRPAHFAVFQHMRPGGARPTELAERAQITKQSMGHLVDHLAARGYVERVADPRDGRAQLVRLTPRGLELERTARALVRRVEADWARRLGATRLEELRALLRELVGSLEGEAAPRPPSR
jgi:DNA-binding MarR family transcriptional regulator